MEPPTINTVHRRHHFIQTPSCLKLLPSIMVSAKLHCPQTEHYKLGRRGASLPGCLRSPCALECLSAFLRHSCPAPCSAPHQGCGWRHVNAYHVSRCSFCLPLFCPPVQTWQRRSPTPREAGNMSPKCTIVRASFPAETCTKSAQTTCCQITPIRQSTTQARVNFA